VGGLVGVGIGGSALATVFVLVLSPGFGPHSETERTFSTAEQLAYPIAATFGAAVLGVGLWALATSGSPNPHQPRIDALREEYEQLTRDYKQERRNERLERRTYSLLPSVTRTQANSTRFMLVLSTTL
jgi:Mn2+/Fe2+ NRAMP family transporter